MVYKDFEFQGEIGKGSFGKVFKATKRNSGEQVAIKVVENCDPHTTDHEVKILKMTNHEYIIKYLESFYSPDGELMIVFEYADAGTFESYNHLREEYCIWRCIGHIASALNYLHTLKPRHILHRDLKPANVLGFFVWNEQEKLEEVLWKVADFGIAKLLDEEAQKNYYADYSVGTPLYMAPEVLQSQRYTFSADVWSLGAVISFRCNQKHLFVDCLQVMNWKLSDPLPSNYSRELKFLITQMLHPDPKSRPTIAKILEEVHTDDRTKVYL